MMNPLSYHNIQQAAISTAHSRLHNRQFDDIYHHPDAIAESQYVFHVGNQLPQQWLNKSTDKIFVIAETGFGSGLNFLTTRRLWQATTNKPSHLHYISTEQWLLSPEHLHQAYQEYPELQPQLAKILHVFEHRRAGFHCFQIDKDITLQLLLGDAHACLKQLNGVVDAWFLDGFAPAKNPAMWSLDLFSQMARLSRPGTTFATYTAASLVRRNLQSAGFKVIKTEGFQGKRNRLIGYFHTATKPIIEKQAWSPTPQATNQSQNITIIGGGIGGLCLAQVAKQYGLQVTLIDQHPTPFAGASGNAYALMMPYLTAQVSPEALFYWRAFNTALNFYPKHIFNASGVQEVSKPATPHDARLRLPADLIKATESGFYYPSSGFINSALLAEHLAAAVDNWLTAKVTNIKSTAENQWLIQDHQQQTIDCCDLLVIAGGIQSLALLPELDSYITARQGQAGLYQLSDWSPELKQAQLDNGHLIPFAAQQQVLIGGSYMQLDKAHWFEAAKVQPQALQTHLQQWQAGDFAKALASAQLLTTYTGIRGHSLDHMPLCGPLVNSHQFSQDYHDLHHGRHWRQYPPAKTHKNLYVLTGLGARGYTSAPLLAQHLMAMMQGQPLPLEQDLVRILHPNRFLYRQLKKAPH